MANRLSDEKARAIAAEYCTNGFRKVDALLSLGYSKTYANNVGLKIFDNDRVVTAIRRIQANLQAKTGFTVQQAEREFEESRLLALKLNLPGAAVSATTGKCRLYGFDKDAKAETKQDRELTEHQKKEARRIAQIRLYEVASEVAS